jgi:hypothetical protein
MTGRSPIAPKHWNNSACPGGDRQLVVHLPGQSDNWLRQWEGGRRPAYLHRDNHCNQIYRRNGLSGSKEPQLSQLAASCFQKSLALGLTSPVA